MGDTAGAEAVWQKVLDNDPANKHVIKTQNRLAK